MKNDQILILTGCFSENENNIPITISGNQSFPTPNPSYQTSAIEADMRIWRHVYVTPASKILMYSPDTDVYNIGIAVANAFPLKEVIVQVNVAQSRELKYIPIHNIIKVLKIDPDIASLPQDDLPAIFHIFFVVSGCDYISYFSGFGKGTFLNIFYQHAQFITGKKCKGFLSYTSEENKHTGFLFFLRLVGYLYFKKHYSAVVSLTSIETPEQLRNSFPFGSDEEQHQKWYDKIRSIVSDRICSEDERIPTTTAIYVETLDAFLLDTQNVAELNNAKPIQ